MKKFLKILGVLVALLLIAIIVIPFVVDVDKYRPQIVQAVNENINGKFELGKLKLSLWGRVRVEAAGLNLSDASGTKVVSVNEAFFDLPFLSLLAGSPSLMFKMSQPQIRVVKDRTGKLNLMSLAKGDTLSQSQAQSAAQTAAGQKGQAAQTAGAKGSVALPAIVSRARLGVEIRDALLIYRDLSKDQPIESETKNLNLVVHNLSLNHKMDLEFWANLDTKLGKKGTLGTVQGPVRLFATAKPAFSNDELQSLQATVTLDMNALDVEIPGTFHKSKGIPTQASVEIALDQKEAALRNLNVQFHNLILKGSGQVARVAGKVGDLKVDLKSDSIDFKPWNQVLPALKDYDLSGSGSLAIEAHGPTDQLQYQAELKLSQLSAKAPQLKARPVINAQLKIITDQIESLWVQFKAPGSELTLKGKVVSFKSPRVDLAVTSPGMDLDQLIEFPKTPATATGAPAPAAGGGSGAGGGAADKTAKTNLDQNLDPLRESEPLNKLVLKANVAIKSFQAKQIKLTDLTSQLSMQNLTFSVDSFKFNFWKGLIASNFSLAMKPKTPTYRFSSKVSGVDLNQAVKTNYEMIKNTVLGVADFEMNGSGASLNSDQAISNLNAKGKFRIKDAQFTTIDVGKMATEAINGGLAKLAEKFPQAGGKKLSPLPNHDTKYEFVSSDFSIAGGKFSAPNFTTKAYPNRGIDLKGTTVLGLKDYSLQTRWEVIDTFNLTHAKDLSVNAGGVDVPHILSDGGGPVKFPVSVGCNVFKPCYSYGETPEYLAKVAMNNITKAATNRVKQEANKRIQEQIQKAAPAPVQNAIDNLKKGFGF